MRLASMTTSCGVLAEATVTVHKSERIVIALTLVRARHAVNFFDT